MPGGFGLRTRFKVAGAKHRGIRIEGRSGRSAGHIEAYGSALDVQGAVVGSGSGKPGRHAARAGGMVERSSARNRCRADSASDRRRRAAGLGGGGARRVGGGDSAAARRAVPSRCCSGSSEIIEQAAALAYRARIRRVLASARSRSTRSAAALSAATSSGASGGSQIELMR